MTFWVNSGVTNENYVSREYNKNHSLLQKMLFLNSVVGNLGQSKFRFRPLVSYGESTNLNILIPGKFLVNLNIRKITKHLCI